MNAESKNNTGLIVLGGVLFLILIGGAVFLMGKGEKGGERGGTSLPTGYGTVPPDARFRQQDGKEIALGELQGKAWVAGFIFTRCRGTCPMMTKSMSELQGDLKEVGDVRLVSFTVDPEYDTPERLQQYAAEYGADQSRWLFLQGSDSAVQTLARETFHVGLQEGGTEEEPIIHSSRFFLVDGKGEIRGIYDGRSDEGKKKLLSDLRSLTDEEGKDGN